MRRTTILFLTAAMSCAQKREEIIAPRTPTVPAVEMEAHAAAVEIDESGAAAAEAKAAAPLRLPAAMHGASAGIVGGTSAGIRSGTAGVAIREGAPSRLDAPHSVGLKAGSYDDNVSFEAFLSFLGKNRGVALRHDVSGRIVVQVRDAAGLPVFGARVRVLDGGRTLVDRRTYPDGRTLIFPSELHASQAARLRIDSGDGAVDEPLAGPGLREVRLQRQRAELERIPVDVAFVLDTTGSMADEIERLRKTLDVIHSQLTHLETPVDIRFGLMEYKDRGDTYVTRPIQFTSDVVAFRTRLQGLSAAGGGDTPEDVQAGLEHALHELQWRDRAVKVAFLIGDAAPHLDYGEQFTYLSAMQEAARRGIKIAAVGCSGLPLEGEMVWRQIAQYTMAPFVFLTRGEQGDMEGSPSTVSHHVGSNFANENLETIVVRLVKSELSHLQPKLLARERD